MRNTILIGLVCLCFLGCSKENYSSTPKLTYQSVNTSQLQVDQIIKFNLTVTDKEGDVIDTMYIQKVSINCPAGNFSERRQIPTFPTTTNLSANIIISYSNGINNIGYTTIASKCYHNDSCYFRFMMKDKANHKSDTVNSGIIVIAYK